MRHLGAGGPAQLAIVARAIRLVLREDDTGADDALVLHQLVGSAAHHLRHLLVWRELRQPLRHDGDHIGGRFRESEGQQREGSLHAEADGAVIGGRDLVGCRHQQLAETVPRTPALDAGHAIPCQHRRAVMEDQAGPQRDAPALLVGIDLPAFGHLRLREQVLVQAEQRVIDQVGVVPRYLGGGIDRVEAGDIRLRDESQHTLRLRRHQGRRAKGGPASQGACQGQGPSSSYHLLSSPRSRCAVPGVFPCCEATLEKRGQRSRNFRNYSRWSTAMMAAAPCRICRRRISTAISASRARMASVRRA